MWDRFTRWRRGGVSWESSSEYEQKFVLDINLEENEIRRYPIWVKKPTLYTKSMDFCRRIALKVKQFLAAIVLFLYECCQYLYYQCRQFWNPECDQTEELVPIIIDGTVRWICPGCLEKPTSPFEKISNYFRRKFAKWNQATIFDVIRVPISVISFVLMPLKMIIWIVQMCCSPCK